MTCGTPGCLAETRRADARAAGRNGIDSISISDDQLTLTLTLFGNAPEDLGPGNFRISGGHDIPVVTVLTVSVCADADPELADCLTLTVDRPGDYSTYRLCVMATDAAGGPATTAHPDFDPCYACMDFSFKQNCPGLLDCAGCAGCAECENAGPSSPTEPVIDYLARDYSSLRATMLDRMSLILPSWTERHAPDLGMTLVELLAAAGDRLAYQQDAVATESYLDTARLRVSVRRHARLVDYRMHDGCAARAFVCLETSTRETLLAGDFRFSTGQEIFEPLAVEDVTVLPAHNRINLWTWGNEQCCLPAGSTSATLRDSNPNSQDVSARVLSLQPGDVLVLQEVLGPRTGLEADADPTHRQAVRLTSVRQSLDQLYGQPLLEVEWDREDRLRFPFCVTSRGGPDCSNLEVGVAFGNVVLVEHGGSLTWCGGEPEPATWPTPPPGEPGCPCPSDCGCPDEGAPGEESPYPPRISRPRIRLSSRPISQSAAFPSAGEVSRGQAARLRGIPKRARARLADLVAAADRGEPPAADDPYLVTLFGVQTLTALHFRDDPSAVLQTLQARFDELLRTKLGRVADLARRARSGYILQTDDEGWEIGQAWGAGEGAALDPDRAEYRGPAAHAIRSNPREALPVVAIEPADASGPPWLPRPDLIDSGPTDRDVVGEVDDDGFLVLRFGDGRAGAVPEPGSRLNIRCRVGNGSPGNVGPGAINTIVFCTTKGSTVTAVRNPLPAAGGTDPESLEEVRQRAPGESRQRLMRAITAADYAALSEEIEGVQRAAADLRWTGSWYEARVALDVQGGGAAPGWLIGDEFDALHRYRRIGHDVSVLSSTLVPLRLKVCVQVKPEYIAGHVRGAVLQALGSRDLPDGRRGLFHPDNLTFGTPVRVSSVIAAVAAVPGVLNAVVTGLQRLFAQPDNALETGVLVLRTDEVAQLDNDPSLPENGVIDLTMGGGR